MLVWKELWDALRAKFEAGSNEWTETTRAMFDAMLGAVPPAAYGDGGFVMGEEVDALPTGEPLYYAFKEVGDKYYARQLTMRQFRAAA